MNYKILASLASLSIACPITLLGWTELENAVADGAKMKMTFVVVDNDNNVVSNAWIQGGMYCDTGASMGTEFTGYSDGNGRFAISGKTTGRIVYSITKDGYYQTAAEYNFAEMNDGCPPLVKSGKWQPYGKLQVVRIKRILNPSVTCWHDCKLMQPPKGCWVGLDLETLRFCPPYGNGAHEDVLLWYTNSVAETGWRNNRGMLKVSFTNQAYAGAYVLKKDEWSDFKSCYVADTNNAYGTQFFKYEHAREPEKILKYEEFPEDSYIVFRTRTKTDGKGNLLSAHYGKIYGPWGYRDAVKFKSVLFNPISNDPNLEESDTAACVRLQIEGMRERGELK